MPGLLKKLDKRPRKTSAPSGRFTASPIVPHASAPVPSGMLSTQEMQRAALTGENSPWWILTPPEPSSKLDTVVPLARSILNQQLVGRDLDEDELRRTIHRALNAAQQKADGTSLSQRESEDASRELFNFMRGKGPLQPLYDDPLVTDIFVDGHDTIRCKRAGQSTDTPFRFRGHAEYEEFMTQLLKAGGCKIEAASPLAYTVLPDAWRSRVHAIHSSILDREESTVAIRIPRLRQVTFYELLRSKALPSPLAAWLSELIGSKMTSVLICGPSGSGKTSFATALLSAASSDERIITIEQVPEISVASHNAEKLLVRSKDSLLGVPVPMGELLSAALRRAPSRLVLGDIGVSEREALLAALASGIPTIAVMQEQSARGSFWGLATEMIAKHHLSEGAAIRRVSATFPLCITIRSENGRPYVDNVSEVGPSSGEEFNLIPLVEFEGEIDGKRRWRLLTSDSQSYWREYSAARGAALKAGPGLVEG